MGDNFTRDLADEAATLDFGSSLAQAMQPGLTVYLHGNLGAGKTTLVRGLLHAAGHIGKVKSPTYALVEPYALPAYNVYHFDLYRFTDEEEWEAAGFRDYFNPQSVCIIEWPEKAENVLPVPDIDIAFTIKSSGRTVNLTAHSSLGQEFLDNISKSQYSHDE